MRTKFTVGEFVEALKKNGYPWIKGQFQLEDASCAVGQAMRNLYGKDIYTSHTHFQDSPYWEKSWNVVHKIYEIAGINITEINDSHYTESYQQVVEKVEEALQYHLDVVIDPNTSHYLFEEEAEDQN